MIHFFTEDADFDPRGITNGPLWISAVARAEKHFIGDLNYIFCSDAYLLQINVDFLQHDYYTDIITFDHSDSSAYLEGDIFISVDRVRENSILEQTTFYHEMLRVIIHGVLHLIGYDDKSESSKKLMRKMEDKYLALYFQDFYKSE